MTKHKNIPFFIPHSGCKNNCTFCSQTKITGFALPPEEISAEAERLKWTVDESLIYADGADVQIAFFGGSFTGIEPERMELLLETAWEYVRDGRIAGIRLSTRPDYITPEILNVLKIYGVTHIELGMQSTDERVLAATNRGHGREECFNSAKLITEGRFHLVGQMMVGLPESSLESEVQTALDIVAMGADAVRIYPTVVFEGTKLYEQCISGEYKPITNDEAVIRSLACLKVFRNAGLDILRIGLHASDELSKAPYGANHPSIGELVYSEEAFEIIEGLIGDSITRGKTLKIYCADNMVSTVSGQKAQNKRRLIDKYGFNKVKIYKNGKDTKIKVLIEAEE